MEKNVCNYPDVLRVWLVPRWCASVTEDALPRARLDI